MRKAQQDGRNADAMQTQCRRTVWEQYRREEMIADRYYYAKLTANEKKAYQVLYDGILQSKKDIPLGDISMSETEANHVFLAIGKDNPFLYWFDQTILKVYEQETEQAVKQAAWQTAWQEAWQEAWQAGNPATEQIMEMQYFCTPEQIHTYNGRIEKIMGQIIEDLDLAGKSEAEKVRRVHDYFCRNISYDYEGRGTSAVARQASAHSVIGVFSRKTAVCEGIAKAFKLILNAVDVNCIVVCGRCRSMTDVFMNGDHMWNIVRIDGKAYHMDVTWDITGSMNCGRQDEFICQDYYCLTDEDIMRDHFDFSGVPACNSTAENYFVQAGLDCDSYDALCERIRAGVARGMTDLYFRYRGKDRLEELMPSLLGYAAALPGMELLQIRKKMLFSVREAQNIGRLIIRDM